MQVLQLSCAFWATGSFSFGFSAWQSKKIIGYNHLNQHGQQWILGRLFREGDDQPVRRLQS
jgi:hypothetical protein